MNEKYFIKKIIISRKNRGTEVTFDINSIYIIKLSLFALLTLRYSIK